ncbi:MAG: cupin domain-containing protein [Methanobacteriota archaeon]
MMMKDAISSREAKVEEREIFAKKVKLLAKSALMEVVSVELSPGDSFPQESLHAGEEFKFVIEGQIEVHVGDHKFFLGKGDWLWHKSDVAHHVKNPGHEKAVYLTIGTPPTFI